MKAHPTVYGGVRFRSRLEARWAAFFDLIRWEWAYEPAEEEGWIPDFTLRLPGEVLAVEVKPIEWPKVGMEGGDLGDCDVLVRRRVDLQKVRDSGRTALVLGAYPIWALEVIRNSRYSLGFPILGILLNSGVKTPAVCLCAAFDLQDRPIVGLVRFGTLPDLVKERRGLMSPDFAEIYWREAGNRTQWRPPRA